MSLKLNIRALVNCFISQPHPASQLYWTINMINSICDDEQVTRYMNDTCSKENKDDEPGWVESLILYFPQWGELQLNHYLSWSLSLIIQAIKLTEVLKSHSELIQLINHNVLNTGSVLGAKCFQKDHLIRMLQFQFQCILLTLQKIQVQINV